MSHSTKTTCIWPASTGPLFLRSVWMGRQGYRHFILNTDWTQDDEEQCSSYKNATKTHRPRQLEPRKQVKLPPDTRTERQLKDTFVKVDEQLGGNTQLPHLKRLSSKKLQKDLLQLSNERNSASLSKTTPTSNEKDLTALETKKSSTAKPQTDFPIDQEEKYLLTERVLQWLDLAGKAPYSDHTATEDNTEVSFPKSVKRVLTANPSLGYTNDNRNITRGSGRKVPLGPLKRTESIHHLSLTLNEDDLVNHPQFKPSNLFHLSLLSGRKLRQMSSASKNKMSQGGAPKMTSMSPKSTTSSSGPSSGGVGTSANASGATGQHKAVSSKGGKKKSLGKLGKTDSIENQYRSMIHRQLLETSCNTQLAKRQLHIFMPMPSTTNTATNQSQNDCDSCLNSLISDGSKA